MKQRWRLLALGCGIAVAMAQAGKPARPKGDACLTVDNRVLGPRSGNRPFPLYTRDTNGFHPACDVTWSALSPQNRPVPVTDCCCQNSMLQVANENACGLGTGPLWVNSRWVVTSAQLARQNGGRVVCQQLETGAWAGTRDFKPDCVQKKKELQPKSVPSAHAPAVRPIEPTFPAPATPAPPAPGSDK